MFGCFEEGLAFAATRTKTARSYNLYRIFYTDCAVPTTYNLKGNLQLYIEFNVTVKPRIRQYIIWSGVLRR